MQSLAAKQAAIRLGALRLRQPGPARPASAGRGPCTASSQRSLAAASTPCQPAWLSRHPAHSIGSLSSMPHRETSSGKPCSYQPLAAASRAARPAACSTSSQPNSIPQASGPFSRSLTRHPDQPSWLAAAQAQLPSSSSAIASQPLSAFPSKAPPPSRHSSSLAARAAKSSNGGASNSNGSISQEDLQQAEAARLADLERKLKGIREQMQQANGGQGVDAFVIPAEDAHQCEYRAPCFDRMAWISGFTGSAGQAVITMTEALLWTDGRYFLQAGQQLSKEWTLMRAGIPGVPTVAEWLPEALPPGSRVGIDPFLHTAESEDVMRGPLAAKGSSLVHVSKNLVDLVWDDERPAEPAGELWVHPVEFAGSTVQDKVGAMQEQMREVGATLLITSLLDEVAWLLNVRGRDVPHCPVAISYAAVSADGGAHLFIDERKLTPEVRLHLGEAAVQLHPYDALLPFVSQAVKDGQALWMDPTKVSAALFAAYHSAWGAEDSEEGEEAGAGGDRKRKGKGGKKEKEKGKGGKGKRVKGAAKGEESVGVADAGEEGEGSEGAKLITLPCPITLAKACKNEAEILGMQRAHLRDAAALARFWAWLEDEVEVHGRSVSEMEVIDRLEQFRTAEEGFIETSFDTIAGANSNGAIIHYCAQPGTCGTVTRDTLLLLDSGGQYVDGTTDVTRTVHLGTPTAYQRECFTRVLQGHIALDSAVFPQGTPGFVLDVLARKSLWSIGLDYRHGTGHGVGACLNVHEGPQGISPRFGNHTPLQPGMVISNEPGFYHDGSFGIRIENLLVVREQPTEHRFGGNTFYGFDRLTMVPMQARLIDLSLMSKDDIAWVDTYHAEVLEKVGPLLRGRALEWLQESTRPLKEQSGLVSAAAGSATTAA